MHSPELYSPAVDIMLLHLSINKSIIWDIYALVEINNYMTGLYF